MHAEKRGANDIFESHADIVFELIKCPMKDGLDHRALWCIGGASNPDYYQLTQVECASDIAGKGDPGGAIGNK